MDPRILVVTPDTSSSELPDALRAAAMAFERVASVADAVSRIGGGDAPDLVVLLGAGAEERAAARQVRKAQPGLALAFVVDAEREATARQALRFEPSIGHDSEVVALGAGVAAELGTLAAAASRRAAHREMIGRINTSLLEPRERPPAPAGTLLERYERLALAVEAAEMGTWELDPSTEVIRADDRTKTIFGLGPDASPDLGSFLALVHEDDRARVHARVRAALERGGPELATEYRAIVGEAEVWIAARARAYDTDLGRRLIGAVQDVTARKRAEQERAGLLRRTEEARREAEEANRIKDEFLATVSHELRTPLSAVLGWARMLRSGALSADRREHAIETIERNARAQAQLIDDLLDVSRILAGKLRLDVRPIDVTAVVEAALEVVRPAADAKGVRLHPILDPKASPIVGDEGRVQQIVWNLLANAVKFTPRGGRVQVRLERVESSIEIVITDSGEGIREDLLPHVFERFRQADGSVSRKHGGLGLGLSIVRHLTELHGGSVRALSEGPGKGATFVVRLPLASATTATPERARAHPTVGEQAPFECPPELEGVRVLVVDDEPDARDLLATVLGSCGARVETAGSAEEALASIAREPPDVVVSDIGMPGQSGYDLIRRIRALPAWAGGRTPAVAITAYARLEDRTRALRAGFQLHAAKPIEPAELLAVVATLTNRHAGE